MKLFKKALVATAIFGAFGAQAADLTDAVKKTSIQGIEVNAAATSSVRAIVREQLEAGDRIKLVFGAGVTGLTGSVTGGAATLNNVGIKYGSGTFTMSQVSISTVSGITTLILEVNTGDPITKDSSFEIEINGGNLDKTKASSATVTYSATSGLDGSAKDTTGKNTGSFMVLADQFAATVKKAYNGVIERVSQITFESNGDALTNGGNDATKYDALLIDATDSAADLLSAATPANITTTIYGNFKNYDGTNGVATTPPEVYVLDGAGTVIAGATAVATDSKLTVTHASGGTFGDYYVVLGKAVAPATAKLPVTSFSVDVDVAFGGAKAFATLDGADAGKWILDATVINIPYFPVGYEGLSTSVHFANENAAAADVLVTAVDNKGVSYSGELADLAAKTVTKVSQTTLQAALKDKDGNTVPNGTKLSVTFNIDADSDTVNAYAMSNEMGVARQQLANSQQKGIK